MNAADRTAARKSNGRLDRVLVLALFAALGGQYWQMFSMNERHSGDIAELNVNIVELNASLSGDIAEQNVRLSGDIAELSESLSRDIAEQNVRLSGGIAELSERMARIESLLQYIVPRPADPPDADL